MLTQQSCVNSAGVSSNSNIGAIVGGVVGGVAVIGVMLVVCKLCRKKKKIKNS